MRAFVQLLTSWGAAGIFLLAILDSAGIPLPAAVDALVLAVAAVQPAAALVDAAVAVLGSLTGSYILFALARKGGQAYLDRVTASGRAARFREWFQRYGLITVFIPALLPIPMPLKVFVISAGALGVRTRQFLLVMLAARVPRYFGLALLGARLGENSLPWLKAHAWHLLGFAVLLGFALGLGMRALDRTVAAER